MKGTRPDWMVQVKKGDTLEVQATYETKLASWYESMGIMVVYMADDTSDGRDPYKTKVDYPGQVTHGHLPENNVHGGKATDLPDPRRLPSGASTGRSVPDQRLQLRRRRLPDRRRSRRSRRSSSRASR